MHALTTSFLMVVLGEMGDKTQLLAMAFAGRFRAWQVMAGVVAATLLTNALAVVVGTYMAGFIPMTLVSIVAGLSFVGFGLWTLQGDTLGYEAQRKSRFGPIVTVATAFFLAEMGDKTQLATVALAAEFRSPVWVLLGTLLGMAVADGLGVWVGDFVSRKISPRLMKYLSAGVFVLFGFIIMYRAMPANLLTALILGVLLLGTAGAAYWLTRKPDRRAGASDRDAA